jgi:hypothetical protein
LLSIFHEATAMARAVEGALGSIPLQEASHMGANARECDESVGAMAQIPDNCVSLESDYRAERDIGDLRDCDPRADAIGDERLHRRERFVRVRRAPNFHRCANRAADNRRRRRAQATQH